MRDVHGLRWQLHKRSGSIHKVGSNMVAFVVVATFFFNFAMAQDKSVEGLYCLNSASAAGDYVARMPDDYVLVQSDVCAYLTKKQIPTGVELLAKRIPSGCALSCDGCSPGLYKRKASCIDAAHDLKTSLHANVENSQNAAHICLHSSIDRFIAASQESAEAVARVAIGLCKSKLDTLIHAQCLAVTGRNQCNIDLTSARRLENHLENWGPVITAAVMSRRIELQKQSGK